MWFAMNMKKSLTIPSSAKSIKPVSTKFGRLVFADNPFIENLCIEIRKKGITVAAGLSISDKDSNEIKAAAVATFKDVDTEEFLKIYTQNIRQIFELSLTAQKIIMPLMLEIQRNAKNIAHVYFSLKIAQKNCLELGLKTISQQTFNRGINELIENSFIAMNDIGTNWYWINPNILFNGDRIRFIQNYRIKRNKENNFEEENENETMKPVN